MGKNRMGDRKVILPQCIEDAIFNYLDDRGTPRSSSPVFKIRFKKSMSDPINTIVMIVVLISECDDEHPNG